MSQPRMGMLYDLCLLHWRQGSTPPGIPRIRRQSHSGGGPWSLVVFLATGWSSLAAIARVGTWINLINM